MLSEIISYRRTNTAKTYTSIKYLKQSSLWKENNVFQPVGEKEIENCSMRIKLYKISSRDSLYSIVPIVNHMVFYT